MPIPSKSAIHPEELDFFRSWEEGLNGLAEERWSPDRLVNLFLDLAQELGLTALDPRGAEMGDSAQWFQFDTAKAKQLVSAAGYPNGFDFAQRYASRNTGASLNVHPILQQQWAAAKPERKSSGKKAKDKRKKDKREKSGKKGKDNKSAEAKKDKKKDKKKR